MPGRRDSPRTGAILVAAHAPSNWSSSTISGNAAVEAGEKIVSPIRSTIATTSTTGHTISVQGDRYGEAEEHGRSNAIHHDHRRSPVHAIGERAGRKTHSEGDDRSRGTDDTSDDR